MIGVPLLTAEEVSCGSLEELPDKDRVEVRLTKAKVEWDEESETWTFYKFATVKGYVTIRWHGTSNGYYSESVTFCQIQ